MMYPLNTLIVELQNARKRLLRVFDVADSTATSERKMRGNLQCADQTEQITDLPRGWQGFATERVSCRASTTLHRGRKREVIIASKNRSRKSQAPEPKAENYTMIRRRLLQLLEHGTVPTMVLAIAIAPPDSRSWQTHDLTKPAKLRTDVLFSASTTGTMTLAPRDCEPAVASTKARCLTAD
jgi:hypothetical protein